MRAIERSLLRVTTIGLLALSASSAPRASTTFEAVELLATDGAANDRFGHSIAVDGDVALVGAYLDDDNGADSGSAYVFVNDGGAWTQQAKLLADDGAPGDAFGRSVAIDGDTALVGAHLHDDKGGNAGAAYVFVRRGDAWVQEAKLVAPDGDGGDALGTSVSVAGDFALLGAPGDDDDGAGSGSAYVFGRGAGAWSLRSKVTASDGAEGDLFGTSVSIDGDTALVGAFHDDDNGENSGSAYVFARNGDDWIEGAKLRADDGAGFDDFGYSVSIDGGTALVGAFADDDNGPLSGSAYVFVRGDGGWSQQAKLVAEDGVRDDWFGRSVAIGGDVALVGAEQRDDLGSASGAAYAFARTGDSWVQLTKLVPADGTAGDRAGRSVSVDGASALVGVDLDDDNGSASGSAYAFDVSASGSAADGDQDGIDDAEDNCPLDPNPLQEDFDEDLIGDACDLDDDNDGVDDADDDFPLDPAESADSDGDGLGNDFDLDDDGDGQPDAAEIACGSDPLDAGSVAADGDGDGAPDCVETDRDGDAADDVDDALPDDPDTSADADGNDSGGADGEAAADDDADGVPNSTDLCPATVLGIEPDWPVGPVRNRYHSDSGGEFVDGRGSPADLTVRDTGGCSGQQIIMAARLPSAHSLYGLSRSALLRWIRSLP